MIAFEKAIESGQPVTIMLGKNENIKGYISDWRVDASTLKPGWHLYELRGADDDPFSIATIEKRVFVNFCGSFLTKRQVRISAGGYRHCRGYVNYE